MNPTISMFLYPAKQHSELWWHWLLLLVTVKTIQHVICHSFFNYRQLIQNAMAKNCRIIILWVVNCGEMAISIVYDCVLIIQTNQSNMTDCHSTHLLGFWMDIVSAIWLYANRLDESNWSSCKGSQRSFHRLNWKAIAMNISTLRFNNKWFCHLVWTGRTSS